MTETPTQPSTIENFPPKAQLGFVTYEVLLAIRQLMNAVIASHREDTGEFITRMEALDARLDRVQEIAQILLVGREGD